MSTPQGRSARHLRYLGTAASADWCIRALPCLRRTAVLAAFTKIASALCLVRPRAPDPPPLHCACHPRPTHAPCAPSIAGTRRYIGGVEGLKPTTFEPVLGVVASVDFFHSLDVQLERLVGQRTECWDRHVHAGWTGWARERTRQPNTHHRSHVSFDGLEDHMTSLTHVSLQSYLSRSE
jgi:hypothetical protein